MDEFTSRNKQILEERAAKRQEARRLSAQKRKKKLKTFLVFFIIFLLLTAAIVVLSLTVFFKINDIQIEGQTPYTTENIVSASGINTGDNLILLDDDQAEQNILNQLIYIDRVEITKKFPGKVIITVEPVTQDYAFFDGNQFFLTSSALKVFDITHEPTDDAVKVSARLTSDCIIGSAIAFADTAQFESFCVVKQLINDAKLDGITHVFFDEAQINIVYKNRIIWQTDVSDELEDKLVFAYSVCSAPETMDESSVGVFNLSEYTKENPSIRFRPMAITGTLKQYFETPKEAVSDTEEIKTDEQEDVSSEEDIDNSSDGEYTTDVEDGVPEEESGTDELASSQEDETPE